MDTTEVFVLAGSVALIALVLWYFFGEREKATAELTQAGVQEIKVTVKGATLRMSSSSNREFR